MNIKIKLFHENKVLRNLLSAPFIWLVLFPLVLLDIALEIYHRICFPLYNIKQVKRKNYIKIDRHKLEYLNFLEKVNCAYCGYANGLLNYAQEIGARTETYWCAIKHSNYDEFQAPKHHNEFLDYGDEKAFKNKHLI